MIFWAAAQLFTLVKGRIVIQRERRRRGILQDHTQDLLMECKAAIK